MYNIFTQWLTLSVIFFAVIYNTQWLEVVTLGGLLTGATVLAAWTAILVRLCRRLRAYTCRAAVIAGVMLGTELLCRLLPGYTVTDQLLLAVFLLLYSLAAIIMDGILTAVD